MKRSAMLLIATAAFLFTMGATARTKPDFSGRWTSGEEPAAGAPRAGDMGSGWGTNITIAQTADRLTIEYAFFARGDMQPPLRFVYALDGSETKNSIMLGRGVQAQSSKTAWEGDRLVITTMHNFDNPTNGQREKIEVKQSLSLESPSSLVVETTRSGVMGGSPSTARTVYKKAKSE